MIVAIVRGDKQTVNTKRTPSCAARVQECVRAKAVAQMASIRWEASACSAMPRAKRATRLLISVSPVHRVSSKRTTPA